MSDMPGSIPPPPPTPGGGFGARPIGEILSAAFDLYRKHWKALITIVAIITVPLTVIREILIRVLASSSTTTETVNGVRVLVLKRSFGAILASVLILAFFSVFVSLVLQGAIGRAGARTLLGQDISPEDAFRFGTKRALPILWVSLLVGLAIAVFGLFLLLVLRAVGVIAFIFLSVFLFTRLAVAVQALVVEDQRGTKALRRSYDLTQGHFWHVLGAVLLAGIIAGIVSGIITAIGAAGGIVLRIVFAAIAAILTTPFTALVGVLIYIDLRARKESLGPDALAADLARSEA